MEKTLTVTVKEKINETVITTYSPNEDGFKKKKDWNSVNKRKDIQIQ